MSPIIWLRKLWSALQLLQKARRTATEHNIARAQTGNPRAQHDLAERYYDGLGAPQDYEQAYHWFSTAARQGYAPSQSTAGMMLFLGRGTQKDPVEAFKWICLAARQGDAKAEKTLHTLRARLTKEQIREAEGRADAFVPRRTSPSPL